VKLAELLPFQMLKEHTDWPSSGQEIRWSVEGESVRLIKLIPENWEI
jgi:hypothetical protein